MTKVLWHITMSLDGFIAAPNDDMAWIADYVGPNPAVTEVMSRIGALLIGARTYRIARAEGGRPYGGAWTGPQVVLTHAAPEAAAPGFTFVDGVEKAVAAARSAAAPGKDVVVLGANAARQCLDAGLLDEVLVHSVPLLLGDGVRMFERPGGAGIQLDPISVTQAGAVTNLLARIRS
ncbi:dihydrofolate reductase family protein [Streptacidiphilus sp. MAP5-3]|uniref:dihydrofolate reductase family protein n=1 Tax=unclassified Streptacidiphilus TaxID=2643834 RepID=UPI0035175971